jgi:hypothetical protein
MCPLPRAQGVRPSDAACDDIAADADTLLRTPAAPAGTAQAACAALAAAALTARAVWDRVAAFLEDVYERLLTLLAALAQVRCGYRGRPGRGRCRRAAAPACTLAALEASERLLVILACRSRISPTDQSAGAVRISATESSAGYRSEGAVCRAAAGRRARGAQHTR